MLLEFLTQNFVAVLLLAFVAILSIFISLGKIDLKKHGASLTFIVVLFTITAALLMMEQGAFRALLVKVFFVLFSLIFWFFVFKKIKRKLKR